MAGFHGDEKAGVLSILKFFEESVSQFLTQCNLSFIPIVNPTGYLKNQRANFKGENPNSGFCHTFSGKPEPSVEGLFLINRLEKIKRVSKDGFLSLHEDLEENTFYLYTFEKKKSFGVFSKNLRAEGQKFFRLHPDGEIEGNKIKDSVIFRQCDGSFEDLLFHEGIPYTACTETPGKKELEKRIEANKNIIMAFINVCLRLHRGKHVPNSK